MLDRQPTSIGAANQPAPGALACADQPSEPDQSSEPSDVPHTGAPTTAAPADALPSPWGKRQVLLLN
ncbi:MAG: hypothetical protein J2O49_04065, partial [Sciscionella sp.]|nr:hypothetical protein [Sciscionella sp.]